MSQITVLYQIGELVTVRNNNELQKGHAMDNVEVLNNAYLVIKDGKFIEIGTGMGYLQYQENAIFVKATNKTVTPGLIDSHTHLIHAGSREHELKMKQRGMSYMDIHSAGGGIFNTVLKTTNATLEELYQKAYKTLHRMMEHGTTTVEVKSGYGLYPEVEIKQLKAIRKLQEKEKPFIVPTYMGAHAIPQEYKDRKHEWISILKDTMVQIRREELAQFCDVFCEEGVFTIEETTELLKYAKELGFGCRLHADEIVPLGGARLAAKLGCASADHLLATSIEDMKLLATENVAATVLPLTSFFLDKPIANIRGLIENGCGVCIATDYNPGSSPCENLQLAMQFAVIKGKMTPKEAITATTINPAYSLGIATQKGSIEVGKDADFVLYDAPNLDYLMYHFGVNHVKNVYIQGELVVRNQRNVGKVL